MKKKKFLLLFLLLILLFPARAQVLVLDENLNRFLINERSNKPRLDLIVQRFTDFEKNEMSKKALLDTITKPTFRNTEKGYEVRANRLAEKMTLVIRNPKALPEGYLLKIDNSNMVYQEEKPSEIAFYNFGGEQCAATFPLPFGPDTVTISLEDKNERLISKLTILYTYPTPELFYITIAPHPDVDQSDTTGLRKFLHYYNQVPTKFSAPNAVPDSLVIAEAELYFGFKKAYYDGKIRETRVMYRFKNGKFSGSLPAPNPSIFLQHTSGDWNWLIDGKYKLEYSYSWSGANAGQYDFRIDHHWAASIMYNLKGFLWLIPMVLMTRLWLTALLVAAFIYFNFRKRLKKERTLAKKTNLELQAIQAQLNPHFVFNALGSLQGLINKQEIETANSYLTDFSRLLRSTLNNSGREMVQLSVEIGNLENYIKLEQMRFGFDYKLTGNEDIKNMQVELPSLLIQPIIENAIKHGIAQLGSNGKLEVTFEQHSKDLIVTVKDNGKGFDATQNFKGKGLNLTRERIKLLNKQKFRISMDFQNDNGTLVSVHFTDWL
ncbi:sensor histidine kinase [Dyadobacter sp. CY343]|uniref:sensor histidine kinase n=1 Tax=Dyadobacter sp. CY343 TaxID=2907299 RepID=UPI001F161449|nr:histidine kinase [Dyadobacter sp. CY343]MCE7063311.1 histidine kinase [Dyadobacter sp. CY343]